MKNTLRISLGNYIVPENANIPAFKGGDQSPYDYFYCKVLLIEDNPGDARLVEILLKDSDAIECDIVHKANLKDAMDAYAQDQFDVVLLDLSLPDSRGFITLETFMGKYPDANVIVLTGTQDKSIGVNSVRIGAQDYLVKGAFDADGLTRALRYSIERNNVLNSLEDAQRIAKIGHWSFNFQTKELSSSKDVFRIFGYDPSALNVSEALVEHNRIVLNTIKKTLEKGEFKSDFTTNTVAGGEISIFVQSKVTQNSKGEIIGVEGVVQDVTARKQREKLEKDRDLALKSAKIKEELLTRVSHEMRTPMNAILGMSNLMKKSTLDEEQSGLVNAIHQNSVHLLGIINDILQISTIQNGKLKFENKPFNLNSLLSNLFNIVQYKLKEEAVKFELEIGSKVPRFVEADPNRLHQVLINLVGNAFKFTSEGVVKVIVETTSIEGDKAWVKFAVKDTGIGIPEDKLRSIFEPFNRVENKEKNYEGTGLGLSIAHNIVSLQGGKMWVESEFGKGSTFFFNIPLVKVDKSDIQKKDEPKFVPIKSNRDIRLLLAEDNKFNQIVAKKTIEKEYDNIKVTIAHNGREAVDKLTAEDFDIVLMDLHMPAMDGYEATAYIRNEMGEEKSKIPILAMTADAQISQDGKFRQFGMDDYVLKPFKPQQLFEKLAFYINKSVVYENQ